MQFHKIRHAVAFLFIGLTFVQNTPAQEPDGVPPLLTPEIASELVHTSAIKERQRQARTRSLLLSYQAAEQYEYDAPGHTIILRRVAPQPWSRPAAPPRAEQAQRMFSNTRKYRSAHFFINVFDNQVSELVWRKGGETLIAVSNIDFNHLASLSRLEHDGVFWQFFCLVNNIDTEKSREVNRRMRLAGHLIDPMTKPDISMLDADFPDYAVYADDAEAIPDEMIEALDVLHIFYAHNRERLEVQWENARTLQAARRAWNEANPPQPRETIINFWIRP